MVVVSPSSGLLVIGLIVAQPPTPGSLPGDPGTS
jgi:hypothetical protein